MRWSKTLATTIHNSLGNYPRRRCLCEMPCRNLVRAPFQRCAAEQWGSPDEMNCGFVTRRWPPTPRETLQRNRALIVHKSLSGNVNVSHILTIVCTLWLQNSSIIHSENVNLYSYPSFSGDQPYMTHHMRNFLTKKQLKIIKFILSCRCLLLRSAFNPGALNPSLASPLHSN